MVLWRLGELWIHHMVTVVLCVAVYYNPCDFLYQTNKKNGVSILTNVKDFFQLKTLIDRTQRERNKEQAKQMNKNCKSTEINYIKRASMTIPHDWETNQMSVLILRLQCIRVLWNRNVKYFCISRKERIEKISIKEHEWFFVYSSHRIAIA